ncbi:MAG: zf-HC2 domain-containing protein [Actinomycetota bacterium]
MIADSFTQQDAAYVLGALSPTERREFERHLTACAACSVAVAELAGLPGLLAKVPADRVEGLESGVPSPVPSTLLPRLVRSVTRRRRRSRALGTTSVAAALTAVAAAVVAIAIPLGLPAVHTGAGGSGAVTSNARSASSLVLEPVVANPLTASVNLVPERWGTRLEMICKYAAASTTSGYSPGTGYAMFVTDSAGRSMQVATWAAGPGSTVKPLGTTSLAVADIRSVDIRSSEDGRVLLRGSP